MGETPGRRDQAPAFDPTSTPVPRRSMLVLMGALAAGSGLAVLLEACAGPPVTVTLDVDPDTLEAGVPAEVPFTLVSGGTTLEGSTWLVRRASGELTAFDPRCTHGLCRYRWSGRNARFICDCHDGQFALDGAVLAGPPPRPLAQFPIRVVGGVVEVDVPGDFEVPRGSLPA